MILIGLTISSVSALRLNDGASQVWPENDRSKRDFSSMLTNEANTLISIRAFEPKIGMLERFTKLEEDLKHHPWANMIIALNSPNMSDPTFGDQVRQHAPQTLILEWNTDLIKSTYQGIPQKLEKAIGWQFHAEALFLSWKHAEKHFGKKFEYIWHLEDDVFICGDFSTIVLQNSKIPSDVMYPNRKIKFVTGRYPWHKHASEEFLNRYRTKWWGDETVQRFSRRLLSRMEELSRKENTTSCSEMFAPTVARNENFTESTMDETEFLEKFSMISGIDKNSADFHCKKMQERYPGYAGMSHKAKWAKQRNGAFVRMEP